MGVPFNRVPSNLRVPLFSVEFDNSMANTATAVQRTLLIGQMLPTGTAKPNIAERVSSDTVVSDLCGRGSMLHNMMTAYMKNDVAADVWILPLADNASQMTAAEGSIKITSVATETGVLSLYIAGIRVQQTILSSYSQEQTATLLASAINKVTALPVSAKAEVDTVTLTAKNRGAHGNGLDIRLNYLGMQGGEVMPSGMTVMITPMSKGAGSPDMLDALSSLQDLTFDFICNPYTDTASLDVMKDFLSDNSGRWSWEKQIYGHSFGTTTGTYAELGTKGYTRNNQHESLMGVNNSPTPAYVWTAAYTGAEAQSLRIHPGRPTQSLPVYGVLAPSVADRFELIERNNLLYSGISTFTVDDDGTVRLECVITTYQKNAYGDADDSYLEVETMFLLMYVVRFLRTQITSRFGRMSLAKDGTRFAPGLAIVTPKIIKADQIAQYQTLEWNGYVQDSEGFAEGLIVEQNAKNPNRVDILWTGVLINRLRIVALLNQFRLQPSSSGV